MATRVGFVGLGNMGLPMALRVHDRFPVVGFDLSSEARSAAQLQGLAIVDSIHDLAPRSDIVVLLLPDSDAVEAVVFGSGLAEALADGAVIVDMGSSDPLRTRALAGRLADLGRHLVDAPVSGGVKGARAGTLTIMAGGPSEHIDRVAPILEPMGRVFRTGGVGSGHATKALNNMLSAVSMLATAEAMDAAAAFGLDIPTMLEVVNASSGRSFSTEYKWPTFVVPETFDSGFSARLITKDLGIATSLSRQLGRPALLGEAALGEWVDALSRLDGNADHTQIAQYVAGRQADA